MLRIPARQVDTFRQCIADEHFEKDTVAYLANLAPRHTQLIGEARLRRVIRLGVERASLYGIKNYGLLRFYIELMFCFGSMFDMDPLLPWASAILQDKGISSEVTRSDRLYQAMIEYLDIVAEPGTAMSLKALRNVKRVNLDSYRVNEADYAPQLLADLRELYPERYGYLGESRLLASIEHGREKALECKLGTDRGIVLTTGLLFVVGHGFATDPLQPWIEDTLNATGITSAEQRVAVLEKRMYKVLEGVLESLEERDHVQV